MGIMYILSGPLGFVMNWLYGLIGNYGFTIILFTILIRIVMFPLSLIQQRSMSRQQAYQPMIQEIQKKWANDKNKQNQEVQKFYEENNIKMSMGCGPMLINMLVLFGIIGVIQAPLNYVVRIPNAVVENAVAIVEHYDPGNDLVGSNQIYTQQSKLVGEMKAHPEWFLEGFETTDEEGNEILIAIDPEQVAAVQEFNFEFMGMNLAVAPTMQMNRYLIMPIISLLTMVGSQLILMLTGPKQQRRGSMLIMTIVFSGMFAIMAFRVPVGFSLYYAISNILQTVQSFLTRKIYDPEKIRKGIEEELEAKKIARKAKKKVKVLLDDGAVAEQEFSEAELARFRLERARKLDEEKYAVTAEEEEQYKQAMEKVAQQEAERDAAILREEELGNLKEAAQDDDAKPAAELDGQAVEVTELPDEDTQPQQPELPQQPEIAPEDKTAQQEEAPVAEKPAQAESDVMQYKPGRRKRASQKKETAAEEKNPAQRQDTDTDSEVSEDA